METSMLLVDDHPVVQMGMKSFIERNELFDRVIIAGTGAETISAIEKQKEVEETFSLAIMDINLPDYEIISLVKRVRKMIPDTPILMFSMEPPRLYIKRLIDLGISGYVDKTTPDEELLFAIRNILKGRGYFSSEVLMETLEDDKGVLKDLSIQNLSDRESEILSLMVKGKNSNEISEILDLHKSSIATYRARVFSKIGVENNFELYKWALREGLIFP